MGLFSKKEETIKILNTNVQTLLTDLTTNITKTVETVSNANQVVVSPNAAVKQITIKNLSDSSITKNLKKLSTLLIDDEFIEQLIDKFKLITETTIYSDIVKFLNSDVLNIIEEKLGKLKEIQNTVIDMNQYIKDIGNQVYTNIIKKIHNTIESQDFKTKIKQFFHNIEQFNFILINTVKYIKDSNSSITKETYVNKKYNIDYLYDFENTVKLIKEKLTTDTNIKDIIQLLFKDLNIEEIEDTTTSVIVQTDDKDKNKSVVALSESAETSVENQSLLDDDEKAEEKDKSEELDIESQEVKPESNVSKAKSVLKSKTTYAIIGTLSVLSLGLFYGGYYLYTEYF